MPNSIARRALVSVSGTLLAVPVLSMTLLVAAPVAAQQIGVAASGATMTFGPPEQIIVSFTDSDKLADRLRRQGVVDAEASAIETALRKALSPRQRKEGVLLDLSFAGNYGMRRIDRVAAEPASGTSITLTRASLGLADEAPAAAPVASVAAAPAPATPAASPVAESTPRRPVASSGGAAPAVSAAPVVATRYAPTPGLGKAAGVVNGDVLQSMRDAGVPRVVADEIVTAVHSYPALAGASLAGSKFEIVYDPSFDANAGFSLAAFTVNGREHRLWRFQPNEAPAGYFTDDGQRVGGLVLHSPMPGIEVNSPFGMRKHPVLRTAKMHWGIDFPAQAGTPIYAAADGTITAAKRYGNYGLYMHIDHGQGVATTYGHVQAFAPGMRPGTAVKAGDVIAYVGRTGLATGPHLYFEVLLGERRVDPEPLLAEGARQLLGSDLIAFDRAKLQAGNTEIASESRN